jgi:asparagine synthase (glutamine-hydrolysing)
MCGIVGILGSVEEAHLDLMTDALAHRGPDGRGVNVFPGDPPAGLGHRRLAILDPTPAGAQPMSYGGRWWITYNGEIYNYRELRGDLQKRGEQFTSDCDTEVLLRLIALEGPAALRRLSGIFAFAVWDDHERRLLLARDRLGVKPLYFIARQGQFAFASELRALLPLLNGVEVDESALIDYLTFLWVPDPKTLFRGITKLPPGHFAWADARGVELNRYWDLTFAPEERTEAQWVDELAETVTRTVRNQMVSDVPLGAFLSGGVDSSAIVAAMSSTGERISTYSIGFTKKDLRHEIVPDDLRHARRVASLFGTDSSERVLEPDVLDLLPRAVWHLEEPVADPAAISTYLICREASKRMAVMLSGTGGDEVFAGYPRYLAFQVSRLLDRIPERLIGGLEHAGVSYVRPGRPGRLRGPRRNLWKFLRGAGQNPFDRYLTYSTYLTSEERRSLVSSELAASLNGYDPLDRHRELLRAPAPDSLSRLLYLDAKTFLPCLNLTYTDKMSMASSVEVRVPLLDDEIVDLTARMPASLKLRGLRRKYVFKRSQERTLPADIVWRRKAGFGAPIRSWLTGPLAPLLEEALSPQTLRSRGLVNPAAVTRMRDANSSGEADFSLQVYALLNLELWFQTFADRAWTFPSLRTSGALTLD